jgi:hypothetical protein
MNQNNYRRVGVDADSKELAVLDQTRVHPNGDEEFHGHVRCWCDLDNRQQSVLRKNGLVNKKGRFIGNE